MTTSDTEVLRMPEGNRKEWDSQVPEGADYPFSASWANVGYSAWGFPPFLAVYDDRVNKAVMPFHLRPLAGVHGLPVHHQHGSDAITPWYCSGPLVVQGDPRVGSKGLLRAMGAFAKENDVANLFIRFHPLLGNHALPKGSGVRVLPRGKVAVVDLQAPRKFGKGCRYAIRHAEKQGVTVGPVPLYTFRLRYDIEMDRKNASPMYRFREAFWKALDEEMKDSVQCFAAMTSSGELASASLEISRGPYVTDVFRVTVPEHRASGATNLLLSEVMKHYEKSCKWFNLGGGRGGVEDTQFTFKASFTDTVMPFYTGKVIWDPRRTLYKRQKTFPPGGYFPAYRRVNPGDQVG